MLLKNHYQYIMLITCLIFCNVIIIWSNDTSEVSIHSKSVYPLQSDNFNIMSKTTTIKQATLTSGSAWLWDAEFHGYAYSGFLFSTGSRTTHSASDVYYGHYVTQGSGPRLWTNNGLGHVIDLGEVDFNTTSTVPSSGWTSTWADAYEGHVYAIQTRDASHYAKLLVKKIDEYGIWFDWVYQSDGSYDVPGYNINGFNNPWVNIISPTNYSTHYLTFPISWNQGADGSITKAEVYANGTLLETLTSGETTTDVPLTTYGFYVINIIVTDDVGGRAYDSIPIYFEELTLTSGSAWLWDAEFHGYAYSGFLFSTGSRVTHSASDVYYGHYVTQGSGPRLWTNNGLGHVIDLGEVDFETTSTVPSSGWTSTWADAYEGHVYGIQTRDAVHYAKLLVTKIDEFGIWFDWVYQSDGSYDVPGYNVNGISNPWVDITYPSPYSTFEQDLSISWNQGADGSSTMAEVYANGTLLETLTSGETSSNVRLTTYGFYVISIIVTDDVGGRAYDSIPIYFGELTLTSGSAWLWDVEFHGYANSGFLFSTGSRITHGDSDVYYGHFVTQGSGPRLWTNNGLGHIIDLGEVDFETTLTVPSSGWTQTWADAYEGHVYGIQTRDAVHYAKLLVKKIDEFGIWFDWVYQSDSSYNAPGYNVNGFSNPWIDITSPSPYSTIEQDLSLSWSQGAAGFITEIYANGTLLETLTSGETTADIPLTTYGLYVISIIVTDNVGLRNYDSLPIYFTPGIITTTSTIAPSSSTTQPITTVLSSSISSTSETTTPVPGLTSGYEIIPLTIGLLIGTVILRNYKRKEM